MSKIIEFIKKIIFKIISFFKRKKNDISYQIKKFKIKNKNNKIKIFFTGFFGYIGSVISSLIVKHKNEKEVNISYELKKIDKSILNIEKSIENETTPLVLKMYKKDINKKISKLKNIKNLKSREENKLVKDQEQLLLNIKDKITVCENKLKGIDYRNIHNNLEKRDFDNKKINENKIVIKNTNKIKKIINKNSNINKKLKNKNVIRNTKTSTKKVVEKIKKGLALTTVPVVGFIKNKLSNNMEVKEENKIIIDKVKKMNKEINNIYLDISQLKNNNNDVKNKENELFLLKEKIKDLKEEYLNLKKEYEFTDLKDYENINNIDPNHLVYHGKAIDDLIEYLENAITKVKNNNIKEDIKIDKTNKDEKHYKENNQVKKDLFIDKTQIELMENSIKKDILLSKEEIKKIRVEIKNLNINNKPTLLSRLSNFFKFSINVGISLIPFGIFKNKLLATLTSGIILNNRIRCMNSLFNDNEINFIKYENILNSIKDRKSCLESTNFILLDTIDEIDKLKQKVEMLYLDNEAADLLINLEEMKLDLLEENVKIETMMEEINGLKGNKIKKKIA